MKDFEITRHNCSSFWDDVQNACNNHFGSRSRSQFWNYSPQMFTILRRCAERMFKFFWLKVKVTITGQNSYDYILCPFNNYWTVWEDVQSSYYKPFWFKVKVAIRGKRSYDYISCLLRNFWIMVKSVLQSLTNYNGGDMFLCQKQLSSFSDDLKVYNHPPFPNYSKTTAGDFENIYLQKYYYWIEMKTLWQREKLIIMSNQTNIPSTFGWSLLLIFKMLDGKQCCQRKSTETFQLCHIIWHILKCLNLFSLHWLLNKLSAYLIMLDVCFLESITRTTCSETEKAEPTHHTIRTCNLWCEKLLW